MTSRDLQGQTYCTPFQMQFFVQLSRRRQDNQLLQRRHAIDERSRWRLRTRSNVVDDVRTHARLKHIRRRRNNYEFPPLENRC